MKKLLLTALLLLSALLCACNSGDGQAQEGVRPVYYITQGQTGRRLGYEVASFDCGKELAQQITDVIEVMRQPVNENNISPIPGDVHLTEVQVFGSTVVVRFSQEYDSLSPVESSLLDAAVTLSLVEIEEISYVRVAGVQTTAAFFQGQSSILLDDEDLRLSAFEMTVYPVDRSRGTLFSYQMRIVTEKEEITPHIVLQEMVNGQLGMAAPFDGRMDVRTVTLPTAEGVVRADLYVPVEMELTGREADIYSIVNSLCSCRGVNAANLTINGRAPSDRGLIKCDGPLSFEGSYLGEQDFGQ